MIFQGAYNFDTNGKAYFGKPLFSGKKVIAFDVDDVLLLHKNNYLNGQKTQTLRTQRHNQSREVMRVALGEFDVVVLWSLRQKAIEHLTDSIYNDVKQKIAGGFLVGEDCVKDLNILSNDLSRVVAIEDFNTFFSPLNRVVQVGPHDDLAKKYCMARALVNK